MTDSGNDNSECLVLGCWFQLFLQNHWRCVRIPGRGGWWHWLAGLINLGLKTSQTLHL